MILLVLAQQQALLDNTLTQVGVVTMNVPGNTIGSVVISGGLVAPS